MSDATTAISTSTAMGPRELVIYRQEFKNGRAYRNRVATLARRRELEAVDREPDAEDNVRDETPSRRIDAPTPGRVAARLLIARAFDAHAGLIDAVRRRDPVVVLVEICDPAMLTRIEPQWQATLSVADLSSASIDKLSDKVRRENQNLLTLIARDPIAVKERSACETRAFAAIQLALPIIVICADVNRCVPKALIAAATHRLTLPGLDGPLVARVIAAVTGSRCRMAPPPDELRDIELDEMLLAIRFDRTPEDCLRRLAALADAKRRGRGSRDLTLDQLHGLDEGVAWGRSLIRDLESWRRGEITWDAFDAGVVFDGPPGTGKTTLARVIAQESGLDFVSATLAKWQGSGEGHLGHLLRAMRADFDAARAKAPCIMFIDELDSFPSRDEIKHAWRDYVVEVVNAFIEQLDGIAGRQGLIFIGATNKIERCEPAIVRAGRLNRIIRIGLPHAGDLERMFRVRLAADLADADLSELCLLSLGSTGADVERIVKDARRFARHEQRPLTHEDLLRAVTGGEKLSDLMRRRAAVHEASHIMTDVLLFGPDGVHAVLANMQDRAGSVIRTSAPELAGTYEDYHRRLQVILAGRAGEELLLGSVSHGAGGVRGSDLERATSLAAAMVGSFGLAGETPLLYSGSADASDLMVLTEVRSSANAELVKAADACSALLRANIGALNEVVDILAERGRIDGSTVAGILDNHGGRR